MDIPKTDNLRLELDFEITHDGRAEAPAEDLLAGHAGETGYPFDDIQISLIARRAGSLVGYAHAQYLFSRVEILRLAVLPTWRGHGIGQGLVTAMEHEGRDLGAHEAHLMTWDFQAEAFYAALGYSVLARLPALQKEAPGKVWMHKPIL